MEKMIYWVQLGPEKRKESNKYVKLVLCRCICGVEKWISKYNIRPGGTRSCGCLTKHRPIVHGMRLTREYASWSGMKTRCLNKNHGQYKNYGGRGIKICKRWGNFENFYKDIGDRPEGKSLDRIDNNGNYKKSNCRWATREEQANNKKNSIHFEYNGKMLGLNQIARIVGIKRCTLRRRMKRNKLSLNEAIKY